MKINVCIKASLLSFTVSCGSKNQILEPTGKEKNEDTELVIYVLSSYLLKKKKNNEDSSVFTGSTDSDVSISSKGKSSCKRYRDSDFYSLAAVTSPDILGRDLWTGMGRADLL